MNGLDEAFMQELLAAFHAEAREHLASISAGLMDLERQPDGASHAPVLETIYREAHSLKGAARAVSLTGIERTCQALESVLAASKRGALALQAGQFDLLYRALDAIADTLTAGQGAPPETLTAQLTALAATAEEGHAPPTPPAAPVVRPPPSSRSVATTADPNGPPSAPQPGTSSDSSTTVRIATAKLDALFLRAEELLAVKQALRQRADDLKDLLNTCDTWHRRHDRSGAARRGTSPLPTPTDMPDGCATPLGFVQTMREQLAQMSGQTIDDERAAGRMIDALLDHAKSVLMLPAAALLQGFPRMVRDLCRSEGKQVELTISGGDMEIDKRILDELKAPLTHLLRNSIDHGIETPVERTRRDKPPCGHIALAFTHADSRTVRIRLSDDGAGIDVAGVKASAVRQGVITADEAGRLTGPEALALVFQSSVSTSSAITELSGRGLGLAIVREKVERLAGRIAVETETGTGTTFQILLPLTLATFRGILVEAGEARFVIPTACVDHVLRVRPGDLESVEGRATIPHCGRTLAFVRLDAVLRLARCRPLAMPGDRACPAVVVSLGDTRVVFGVDRILGEQEGVVKDLGSQIRQLRHVAGATLLATGELVPILDPAGLLKSAADMPTAVPAAGSDGPTPAVDTVRKTVLLVEDSITSRILIKHILESAGYAVTTSIDGEAAWLLLKTRPFNAVVSDVEMPRLDGFALTTRIRATPAIANLPVILVTARESREDQARGVDAGANAYIIKRRFEQSDLLSTLERLI
ncbi:MAG: response regulator [Lentisphaerae bacterium]|nr:response regulator [Lentisphaerota bacterium]